MVCPKTTRSPEAGLFIATWNDKSKKMEMRQKAGETLVKRKYDALFPGEHGSNLP